MPALPFRPLAHLTTVIAVLAVLGGVLLPAAAAGASDRSGLGPASAAAGTTTVDAMTVEVSTGAARAQTLAWLHERGLSDATIGPVREDGWVTFQLGADIPADRAVQLTDLLQDSSAAVGRAAPEITMHAAHVPNDHRYARQWALHPGRYRTDTQTAWRHTRGSEDVVVAVLDTGSLPHPDVVDRTIPGYSMIDDPARAGNTYGRGPDTTDTGNICPGVQARADWHGLGVAATIGATAGNGSGTAGVDHHARIQHVRVLGRCGGAIVDIADGIRWAGGGTVAGVPDNPTPADVINLSLGAQLTCHPYLQDAIDVAVANGATVVAAAMNSNVDLDQVAYSPADCDHVITVTATSPNGDRAGMHTTDNAARQPYANYGSHVDIAAPGGDTTITGGQITTAGNRGVDRPAGHITTRAVGTSYAAPHVSGAVALMLARNPQLTNDEILTILQQTAGPFASASRSGGAAFTCATDRSAPVYCGAGILNTAQAVAAVDGVDAPDPVTLAADVLGGGIVTLAWEPGLDATVSSVRLSEDGSACTYTSSREVYRGRGSSTTIDGLDPSSEQLLCHFLVDGNGQVSLSSNVVRVAPTDPPAPTFSDVSAGGSHAAAISWMAQQDITTGCATPGAFCPDDPVTREQMATFLTRALDLRTVPGSRFSDVAAGSTHAPSVEALVRADITRGCSIPGAFCPRDTVTRAQMASFLARAQTLTNGPVGMFVDVPAGSSHAGPIGAMYRENITRGCSKGHDHYCPTDAVTRAQMASFLHRALT